MWLTIFNVLCLVSPNKWNTCLLEIQWTLVAQNFFNGYNLRIDYFIFEAVNNLCKFPLTFYWSPPRFSKIVENHNSADVLSIHIRALCFLQIKLGVFVNIKIKLLFCLVFTVYLCLFHSWFYNIRHICSCVAFVSPLLECHRIMVLPQKKTLKHKEEIKPLKNVSVRQNLKTKSSRQKLNSYILKLNFVDKENNKLKSTDVFIDLNMFCSSKILRLWRTSFMSKWDSGFHISHFWNIKSGMPENKMFWHRLSFVGTREPAQNIFVNLVFITRKGWICYHTLCCIMPINTNWKCSGDGVNSSLISLNAFLDKSIMEFFSHEYSSPMYGDSFSKDINSCSSFLVLERGREPPAFIHTLNASTHENLMCLLVQQ